MSCQNPTRRYPRPQKSRPVNYADFGQYASGSFASTSSLAELRCYERESSPSAVRRAEENRIKTKFHLNPKLCSSAGRLRANGWPRRALSNRGRRTMDARRAPTTLTVPAIGRSPSGRSASARMAGVNKRSRRATNDNLPKISADKRVSRRHGVGIQTGSVPFIWQTAAVMDRPHCERHRTVPDSRTSAHQYVVAISVISCGGRCRSF